MTQARASSCDIAPACGSTNTKPPYAQPLASPRKAAQGGCEAGRGLSIAPKSAETPFFVSNSLRSVTPSSKKARQDDDLQAAAPEAGRATAIRARGPQCVERIAPGLDLGYGLHLRLVVGEEDAPGIRGQGVEISQRRFQCSPVMLLRRGLQERGEHQQREEGEGEDNRDAVDMPSRYAQSVIRNSESACFISLTSSICAAPRRSATEVERISMTVSAAMREMVGV